MVENFPNIGQETHIQLQEAQKSQINTKRLTHRHIIVKMAQIKENFKGTKIEIMCHIQRKPSTIISLIFLQKLYRL